MRPTLIALAAIALIALSGCYDEPDASVIYRREIPPENRDAAAAWIAKTVEAANPHSDEEPEDNIAQAERTATALFGRAVVGLWDSRSATFVPYWDCDARARAMCDAWVKGGAQ